MAILRHDIILCFRVVLADFVYMNVAILGGPILGCVVPSCKINESFVQCTMK